MNLDGPQLDRLASIDDHPKRTTRVIPVAVLEGIG